MVVSGGRGGGCIFVHNFVHTHVCSSSTWGGERERGGGKEEVGERERVGEEGGKR